MIDLPRLNIELLSCLSALTDITFVKRLIELVGEGRRVYALFGASHAIQQEAAIRQLIGGS